MTRIFPLKLIISLLCLISASPAFAKDGMFGVGARFAWDSYERPVLVHSNESAGVVDLESYGAPNIGGELQVHPIERLSISLGIDMGFFKSTAFPYTNGNSDVSSKASFFTFGFLVGGKFYVMKPEVERAALYLHLAAGKYFAKAKNPLSKDASYAGTDIVFGQTEVVSRLASPIVVQLAVGAEYFISKYFSIGADILGFRMGYASADVGQLLGGGAYSGEHKLFTFSVYSALTLNFGFAGSDKKQRAIEGDGDADAWGAGAGGGAAGGAAGGTDDGWGASAGGDAGWGSTPEEQGGDSGWGAQPAEPGAAAPAGGGWEAEPPAAEPEQDGGGGGGGGGRPRAKPKAKPAPATPPPPPPGY